MKVLHDLPFRKGSLLLAGTTLGYEILFCVSISFLVPWQADDDGYKESEKKNG